MNNVRFWLINIRPDLKEEMLNKIISMTNAACGYHTDISEIKRAVHVNMSCTYIEKTTKCNLLTLFKKLKAELFQIDTKPFTFKLEIIKNTLSATNR